MTTASFIIALASGMACAACFISAALVVADVVERRIKAAWWRKRDPLWIDPLSHGASASHHGCSDPHTDHYPTPYSTDRSGTSHPQPNSTGLLAPNRTPGEFISALMASGALRRVA